MKPKIVFFDLDGTLLDHQKKIPDSAARAVFNLQEQGIMTAIATGRAPFMHHTIRDSLGIDSFISYNGQYVVLNGNEVYKNPISIQGLEELNKKTTEHLHPVTYMGTEAMGASHSTHPFILKSFQSLKQPLPSFNPHFYKNNEIYQALLFFEKEARPTYLDDHDLFDVIQWHEHSMDVVPKGGNKAKGIQAMLQFLEMDASEAVAFGDGLNDIDMLKYVGHGVAMGNAVTEAKEAARDVTLDADQDGIAFGLKKMGLIS